MSFRQDNKEKLEQARMFERWREENADLIARSGVPDHVLRTRDDWAYYVRYGYHDRGNWNTPPFMDIDFTSDMLNVQQARLADELVRRWREFVARHPVCGTRLPAQ